MLAQEEIIMIKGKRSKRPRIATTSSSTVEHSGGGGGVTSDVVSRSSDRVAPSPSDSGDLTHDEEEDMANCLILLAKGLADQRSSPPPVAAGNTAAAGEVYQCKTCNKSFPSFQALGGHRASHRKANNKPVTLDDQKRPPLTEKHEDNSIILSLQMNSSRIASNSTNKSRIHECSLCGAEFASGQALGGHMRRHRPIPVAAVSGGHGESREVKRPRSMLSLDLNLPAPPEDDHHAAESKFPFVAKEQVIVFAASPLVDCHY